MKEPRCKGTILPTMRNLPIGRRVAFPLDKLGALRTGSWYLNKNEGLYFSVNKQDEEVFVTRTF